MNKILIIAVLVSAFGIQDPKIKQAILELTPQVGRLEMSSKALETAIDKMDELVSTMETGKIKKEQASVLMAEIDKVKAEVTAALTLEKQAKFLSDTLAALDKKSKRANKVATTKLIQKVNAVITTIKEAKEGCADIDELKTTLKSATPGKPEKPKPAKGSVVVDEKYGIKAGMTKEEVKEVMGDPERNGLTWWTYILRSQDGTKQGALRVDFDDNGKVCGLKEISQ